MQKKHECWSLNALDNEVALFLTPKTKNNRVANQRQTREILMMKSIA